MAVRPDFQRGNEADLTYLPQLLAEFQGTPLEQPFAHIGNAIGQNQGQPLDPETAARTMAEAKRLMMGGIPRDQLDELKGLVKTKFGEFFQGAKSYALWEMPPHLMDAKDILASQVQTQDIRAQAFTGRNLGKTLEDMQRERESNAVAMATMWLDNLTAELTTEDASEIVQTAKTGVEEFGGGKEQEAGYAQGVGTDDGLGPNRSFPGTGPGTVGTQPVDRFPQDSAIDVDSRKIDGPFSAVFPADYEGGGFQPRQDMDFAKEAMDVLEPDDLTQALQMARELIEDAPERQIAKFQDPNPLMWVGVALAGIFFPEMRPSLLALPFQVGLGEMNRQQALFDKAYADGDEKRKRMIDLLLKRADIVQRERTRTQNAAIEIRQQDLLDAREWAKLKVGQDEETLKRMDALWKQIGEYVDKGGTRETVLRAIQEVNSYAPKNEKGEQELLIDPEMAQAILNNATSRYGLESERQRAGVDRTKQLTESGEWRLSNQQERWEITKPGLAADTQKKISEAWLKQFEVMNAPQDLAMKWMNDWAQFQTSMAGIENMDIDNDRAAAQLELAKLNSIRQSASEQIGILKERKSTVESQLGNLSKQLEAAILSRDTAAQTQLNSQITTLKGQLTEWETALGKEGGEVGVHGRQEGATGMYGYLNQITEQIKGVEDSFGGITRPNAPQFPGGEVKIPPGFGDSNKVTKPTDSGKFHFDNGGTIDLNQTYKFGAKGEGGATDCSGAVCSYIKSTGSPAAKDFPQGSHEQIKHIESKIAAKDPNWARAFDWYGGEYGDAVKEWGKKAEAYNKWADAYNKADSNGRIFLLNEEPEEPGKYPSVSKFLRNGDIVYFNVPKTGSNSGRHTGIFVGLDKDGNALIAEAYSANVPDAEQVRIATYDLDKLWPFDSEGKLKPESSGKYMLGAYRFYPKGK